MPTESSSTPPPTGPQPPVHPLDVYLVSQQGRFTTNGVNHFNNGVRRIIRYLKFLDFIVERHGPPSDALRARMDNSTHLIIGTPPPFMVELVEHQRQLDLAHLDIESYYLFSKILLDWVARWVEYHYGQGQKASLDSHDQLTKNIEMYAAQRGLTPVPDALLTAMRTLKKDIADYRDYQIAHPKNFRAVQGTSVGPKGPTMGLGYVNAYFPGRDPLAVHSRPLTDLAQDLWDYFALLTAYLTENQDKAVFERRPAT